MQQSLLAFLMKEDEITWQSILLDLIKTGEMNPWDIDISELALQYIEVIKKLQEANMSISGKVILAAAILLKIKCERLIVEDIGSLDNLMFPPENIGDLDDFGSRRRIILDVDPRLTIKTPQARKKKVSVNDLILALEKALEVNERRIMRIAERNRIPEMVIPGKKIDISKLINELYDKIILVLNGKSLLTFSELLPSQKREDKILTLIPLLHLATQEKIHLDQKEHLGEIHIMKNENLPDVPNLE